MTHLQQRCPSGGVGARSRCGWARGLASGWVPLASGMADYEHQIAQRAWEFDGRGSWLEGLHSDFG